MPESPQAQIHDALEELVNQFSDPMAFLRELIQNAIDAGSEEVEVRVTYKSTGRDRGITIVAIDDWGEGMTREIIDKRLTRLFSSAKDGDQTKIGKFGIGFVSVFAIEPDAVCIDTAREGESWRVLFDADRTYKLIARDEPVDGTKIQVIKATERQEHEAIERRAGEVLRYWCKHVKTEILFQGEPIAEPFGIEGARVSVERDDGFSHIVVAHHPAGASLAGFYNSGLTLMETADASLPGYAYKINSPHLEHTLTRDAVIRDEGYDRVIEQVRTLIAGPLLDAALAQLAAAWDDAGTDVDRTACLAAVARHAAQGHLAAGHDHAAIVRAPSGVPVTLGTLRGAHKSGTILLSHGSTPLSDALADEGFTVLLDHPIAAPGQEPSASDVTALVRWLAPACEVVHAEHRFFVAVAADPTPGDAALCEAVRAALVADGCKVDRVGVAALSHPDGPVAANVAAAVDDFGRVAAVADALSLPRSPLASRRSLAINAKHPAVGPLRFLAGAEPELAAYLLVKHFLLGAGLEPTLDTRLVGTAIKARWNRLTTS